MRIHQVEFRLLVPRTTFNVLEPVTQGGTGKENDVIPECPEDQVPMIPSIFLTLCVDEHGYN